MITLEEVRDAEKLWLKVRRDLLEVPDDELEETRIREILLYERYYNLYIDRISEQQRGQA